MKLTKNLLFATLAVTALIFSSCSDDDKDGVYEEHAYFFGAKGVFSNNLPKKIGDGTLTYDAKSFLENITSGTDKFSFEYPEGNNPNGNIIMKANFSDSPESNYTLAFEIGKNGFATKAMQTYADKTTETWEFAYNADGQLNYMKRSEDDNEVTNITYTNGNITSIKMEGDDKEEAVYTTTLEYTSEAHPVGLDNKANIMLFDETFGIDMDEMSIAYYAGLLGHSTKQLPLKLIESYSDIQTTYTTDFNWTIDSNGYPTKLVTIDEYEDYEYNFSW